MKIKLTTNDGMVLQYFDVRDVVFIEKRIGGFFMMQWYDEWVEDWKGSMETRQMYDIATVELTND